MLNFMNSPFPSMVWRRMSCEVSGYGRLFCKRIQYNQKSNSVKFLFSASFQDGLDGLHLPSYFSAERNLITTPDELSAATAKKRFSSPPAVSEPEPPSLAASSRCQCGPSRISMILARSSSPNDMMLTRKTTTEYGSSTPLATGLLS